MGDELSRVRVCIHEKYLKYIVGVITNSGEFTSYTFSQHGIAQARLGSAHALRKSSFPKHPCY